MTNPSTKTITLSEDGLKILRWLAALRHSCPTARRIGFAALGLPGAAALVAQRIKPLIEYGLVERVNKAFYRITPAGRAFISEHYPEPPP